ncbi:hypothetical protein L249_0192 [Ophiocordyceps polyrhachis-furcata BCC 54312]|uniref:DUF7721 domain-containing protein n=1 Tax=Ophiocordyceps polyrhachis-furcata BCC 54312 TaxID=1330021 RepID=A0A367LFB9_9HYPO|nr:hypothetical protein L249_0192 [Ophiocordyceps polyrhachis-furcata BCC 54312]
MDKLINAGKDYLANQGNQGGGGGSSDGNSGGGQGQTRPSGSSSSGGGGGGGGGGGSGGGNDMMSQIMNAVGQRKGELAKEDIDEDGRIVLQKAHDGLFATDAARKHKQTYQDDAHGDENSLAAAAAMQAFKRFKDGQGGGSGDGAKDGQSSIVSMALSEASKLFDDKESRGKVPAGADKQTVLQKAGEMAMKLYFKNQAQKQGGLVGMASQFMK